LILSDFEVDSYSDAELAAEFDRSFPQGFAGPDVLHELAPQGWALSPLLAVFHPTLEQVYEETRRLHENLRTFRRLNDPRPEPLEPTLAEVAKDFREQPIEAERELRELVGQCLWDVFSDNHEVVDADGRILDLGSFRTSGGFLADVLNRQIGADHYDYLSFYLGTIWVSQRADLTPVYEMIFHRLRARGLDWVYHFPQIYAVDMRPLTEALDRKDEPEWVNYDPSEALAKEEANRERDRELAELRESLDQGFQEAIEEAVKHPPPATVRAYMAAYGSFPRGWPPMR
jgi:hypothetical protein